MSVGAAPEAWLPGTVNRSAESGNSTPTPSAQTHRKLSTVS